MASNKTAANSLWQAKAMPLLHHKRGLLDCCNHTKDAEQVPTHGIRQTRTVLS